MAKREQMLRLKFIENFLRIRGYKGASFKEIERYLIEKFEEKEMELKFTERTFMRDKKNIFDISGIEITYNRKYNKYIISEEELENHEESVFDNMLLVEAYRETKNRQNIMFFENRKSRGFHNFNGLIHAIINRKLISCTYSKFWTDVTTHRILEPYALKEFRHRWYLLAREHNNESFLIKTFGLDRISDLEIHNGSFIRQPYDVNETFKNSFGIISTKDMKAERVIIEFSRNQGQYVKAMPLHSSQRILEETEDKIVFELHLVPTFDFLQEILSYGMRAKVISPEKLKREVVEELQKNIEQY